MFEDDEDVVDQLVPNIVPVDLSESVKMPFSKASQVLGRRKALLSSVLVIFSIFSNRF